MSGTTIICRPLAALLACFISHAALAQMQPAPEWESAVAFSQAASNSTVNATAADDRGNIYLVGKFDGKARFGSTVLTSNVGDLFVAKWSPVDRDFMWVKQAAGGLFEEATAVAVSGNNVYVAGIFDGPTVTFGSTTLRNTSINNNNDGFVAKLTDNGTTASFVWAQPISGQNEEKVTALAASGSNVYVTGTFNSIPARFGALALQNSSIPFYTGEDIFLAKLIDAGPSASFAWAQRIGGPDVDASQALLADGNSLYLAGDFSATVSFGTTTLTAAGGQDGFVARLRDEGTACRFDWVQSVAGPAYDRIRGLVRQASNLYLVGEFGRTARLGSLSLNAAGSTDVFVAKLTDTGTITWVQQGGGTADESARTVAVTESSVYISGFFSSRAVTFGTTTLTNTAAGQMGGIPNDMFLAKLTDSGASAKFTWVQQTGNEVNNIYPYTMTAVGRQVYVGGTSYGYTSFGRQLVNQSGHFVGFLAMLTDVPPQLHIPKQLADLKVYPNPAQDQVTVLVPGPPDGTDQVVLTLIDRVGRVVRTVPVALPPNGLRYPLSLLGLRPGIYVLRVQIADQFATRTLIVIE